MLLYLRNHRSLTLHLGNQIQSHWKSGAGSHPPLSNKTGIGQILLYSMTGLYRDKPYGKYGVV